MQDPIRIGRRLIPLEQIALIEPYTPDPQKPLNTTKQFQSRIILLDKDSVLSEEPVAALASKHAFRMIQADGAATNPELAYWVELFEPDDSFNPEKPFRTRLLWREASGLAHSRLLLALPENVLAIAVRGMPDPDSGTTQDAAQAPAPRGRRRERRRASEPARDPV